MPTAYWFPPPAIYFQVPITSKTAQPNHVIARLAMLPFNKRNICNIPPPLKGPTFNRHYALQLKIKC